MFISCYYYDSDNSQSWNELCDNYNYDNYYYYSLYLYGDIKSVPLYQYQLQFCQTGEFRCHSIELQKL